jgi:hypothetical protein
MLRVFLTDANDLPPGGPRLVTGIDSAAVALQAVFGTQQGEWPFDFTFGCPWRGEILQKFFDPGATRSIMANTANTVPDIQPVVSSQVSLDTTTQAAARQVNITISDVVVGDEQAELVLPTVI